MLHSQWANLGDALVAGVGDVVKVRLVPNNEWWDVTALGEAERVAEDLVRLPVRVTSRFRAARPFIEDTLQIGTTPDEFGVIQHLWTPRGFDCESVVPEDCLHSVVLRHDETREGAVYFSPTGVRASEGTVAAPFTTLWCGITHMEIPVRLALKKGYPTRFD